VSPEEAAALRKTATGLRLKASAGVLAVAAAKDVAATMARELARRVEADLDSGELAKRYERELEVARAEHGGDAPIAALLAMLAWHGKLAAQVASDYATKIEGDRRAAEGRAVGIEETLAAFPRSTPEPPP
jgi:hypothetical protein